MRTLYFRPVVSSSSFPYFYTWCGLRVNLECRSEMRCTRLAGNTGCKNDAKNRYLRTIAQLCRAESSQRRHMLTIGKNLLNSNISSTCFHSMANFGPPAAEIGSGVWGTPANFHGLRVLASLLQRRRSPEAKQTLHDVWSSPGLLLHYIYIFGGFCPLAEFRHVQNSLCVQVLRSPILAALLHGTPAAVSAKLSGVVQVMELGNSRRAPPVFGWTAIRLGIGPHSSFLKYILHVI